MSFWSAWWRRRAAGVPDTARPAHGRADGDDRSGATGRQAAPEAVQDAATPQDGIAVANPSFFRAFSSLFQRHHICTLLLFHSDLLQISDFPAHHICKKLFHHLEETVP